MTKRKTHPRIGSDFEDFLRDEGRLEKATAVAIKRVLAWEIQRAMDCAARHRPKWRARMKTSRAVVRRLLDDNDPSVTLATISRAPCPRQAGQAQACRLITPVHRAPIVD